jgi:hypothetical protein
VKGIIKIGHIQHTAYKLKYLFLSRAAHKCNKIFITWRVVKHPLTKQLQERKTLYQFV